MIKNLFGVVFSLTMTLLIFNTTYGDAVSAISKMGESSSNYIIDTLEEAYDDCDYDLFEACAQRAFELELEASIKVFDNVFADCNPDANELNPTFQAKVKPYFYVAVLAYGHFGDDYEAGELLNAMIRNDDDFVTWYIFKALGYMTESEKALTILNEATGWVDSVLLADQLIESLVAHNSYSSIIPLTDLLDNPRLKGLKAEVETAVDTIVASQPY